jgi:hypothetical protein
MPLYDFQCRDCGNKTYDQFVHTRDEPVYCGCGSNVIMQRLFPTRFVEHVWPAEGIHLRNVCPEGKTFYSKSEMKRYAREHNLELGALL